MPQPKAPEAAPAAKPNRWLSHFGSQWNNGITFEAIIPDGTEPEPFKSGKLRGTKQYPQAHAYIEVGDSRSKQFTGGFIPCRVVGRLYPNGKKEFLLVWPNSTYAQGAVHQRLIDVKSDENAASDLDAFGVLVVEEWKKFQKDRKSRGETTTAVKTGGMSVTDQDLEDLGVAVG